MPALTSPVALPLALVAGSMVLLVAACGGETTTSPGAGQPTVTVTPSATSAASASPSATGPGTTGGGSDRCDPDDVYISYADDKGGAGAGSVMGTFTILNQGSASCTLRGFPGVSYVGGDNGVQVGQPATRTDDEVTTKTLAAGKTAEIALRRAQPRNYGDACQEAEVTGFRVYLPDSTTGGFVKFATTGCKSTSAPLLQVGPVR